MDESHWQALLRLAEVQMRSGNVRGAIESLRRMLSAAPDHGDAHALLALCLLDQRRLHAATYEASLALNLEPESILALSASARVLTAERKFAAARERWEQVRLLDPTDAAPLRALAHLEDLEGRPEQARALLEEALALAPDDVRVHVDLAENDLENGRHEAAEARAREILSQIPEQPEALVIMGHLLLRRGAVEEAREHAVWVLRNVPDDHDALALMAAVKARQSPLLGLWWRYSVWMGRLGDGRAILVLLGAFVLYRFGVITAELRENKGLAEIIQLCWLIVVAYTWVGPGMFQRSLNKEIGRIELNEDF